MATVGIDLGTTNSLGCVYRNGKAELIPNAYGSYLTPSVVSMMEDGRLVVGQPAKDRLIAEHFLREHGVARQQLRAQEYAVLLKQAERCKKLLSEQDEVVMHATVGDQLYESTYTMDRLFEESKALLKEIRGSGGHGRRIQQNAADPEVYPSSVSSSTDGAEKLR